MSIQPISRRMRLVAFAAGLGMFLVPLTLALFVSTSLAAPAKPPAPARVAPTGKSNIGNYVWRDVNLDGDHLTTPAENEFNAGINGVLVNLYLDANQNGIRDDGPPISTTVTADNPSTLAVDGGWYNFDITAEGNYYIVEIDASNFGSGKPLEGYVLTSGLVYPILPAPPPAQWVTTAPSDLVIDVMDVDFGFALAAVQLVKQANGVADGGTAYILPPGTLLAQSYALSANEPAAAQVAGTPVLYSYKVTNTGDTYLVNITVKDDNGTPGIPGDDFTVCTIPGPLAPNASDTCTTTRFLLGDRTNVATVTGTPSDAQGNSFGGTTTDTDDAMVDMVNPGIQVVKTANNAADGTVEYIKAGDPVTYTYTVTNTGDTPLGSVGVNDNKCVPALYASGDTNPNNTLLDLTETWIFTCTATISINTTNVATVTGTPTDGNGVPLAGIPPVQDEDDAVVQLGGSIGDLVWWDINDNGVQGAGEPGIPGVEVKLSGPVNQTTTTDANGIYTFSNLPPGSYTVSIPAAEFGAGGTLENWTGSPQNVPPDDTKDSDADPVTQIANVVLLQGQNDPTIDFGFDLPSSYVITKQFAGFEPFAEGEAISFTIRITNTGLSWITLLPVTDVYTPTYLTYGFQGSYSKPTSDDNANDGQINWSDLTTGLPYGNGFDLAPGVSTSIIVTFTAGIDTGSLPFSRTVNVAEVSGAFADPDGPQGPLPPDEPLPDQQAIERVRIVKPTGVTLDAISARARGNDVVLRWQTESEANILGFNVYRSGGSVLSGAQDVDTLVPVNTALIEARGSGANQGGGYHLIDEDLQPGVYSYVVEVIRLDGVSWRAAPVVVVVGGE